MLRIFDLCIGYNMWYDKYCPLKLGEYDKKEWDFLFFDKDVLSRVTDYLKEIGYNAVVLELAEGVKYSCAPEIGVKGSLTPDEIKKTVESLKEKGFTVIPKLDFSAAHDIWLGDYSRMLSTKEYNELTKNLINEVCDLFGSPEYFHLGLGDEYNEYQQYYGMILTRGIKSFKNDVDVLINACKENSAKPIVSGELYTRESEVFKWTFGTDVIIDVNYKGSYVCKSDFFGRDKRSELQKKTDEIFDLGNPVIASVNRAPSVYASDYFNVAKSNPNTIGIMISPALATVEHNEIALKAEAKRNIN